MHFTPVTLAAASALGLACAHGASPLSLPPHPGLVRPSEAVSPAAASLSGAWQGVGDDGVPTVMLVPIVEPAGARVLLAREPRPGAPGDAWHAWADVPFGADASTKLSWQDGTIAFALDPGADVLRGQLREGARDVVVTLERMDYPTSASTTCPIEQELRAIARAPSSVERSARAGALLARVARTGAPVIEVEPGAATGCVTWLYGGPAQEVLLAGDMNGWHGAEQPLVRVGDTDLWFVSLALPTTARLDYKFVVEGKWLLDPLNQRTMLGGYGPNSELALPGYAPPQDVERAPAVPRGALTDLTIRSRHMGDERMVKVYLPPGYEHGEDRYPVLYVHDGTDPIEFGAMDAVLDNLIARGVLPPVIAVFVAPVNRFPEYLMNTKFEAFFLEPPARRTQYIGQPCQPLRGCRCLPRSAR